MSMLVLVLLDLFKDPTVVSSYTGSQNPNYMYIYIHCIVHSSIVVVFLKILRTYRIIFKHASQICDVIDCP